MSESTNVIDPTFDKISVVIADPDGRTATSIKYALQSQSFQNFRVCTTLDELTDTVQMGDADVLIVATEFADGDVLELVQKIRKGAVGEVPFAIVIGLAEAIDEDLAKRVLNAGVDDLILKPISAAMLMNRLMRFTRSRKPFVVTADYTGPDRRRADSGRPNSAQMFDVPNPIRFKVLGNGNSKMFRKSVEDCLKQLKHQRIHSVTEFVHRQIEYVMPCCLDDVISLESMGRLETLKTASETARDTVLGSVYASHAATFEEISQMAQAILGRAGKPAQDDFDALFGMAQSLEKSILNERRAA